MVAPIITDNSSSAKPDTEMYQLESKIQLPVANCAKTKYKYLEKYIKSHKMYS